jgi:hypothetical protein
VDTLARSFLQAKTITWPKQRELFQLHEPWTACRAVLHAHCEAAIPNSLSAIACDRIISMIRPSAVSHGTAVVLHLHSTALSIADESASAFWIIPYSQLIVCAYHSPNWIAVLFAPETKQIADFLLLSTAHGEHVRVNHVVLRPPDALIKYSFLYLCYRPSNSFGKSLPLVPF